MAAREKFVKRYVVRLSVEEREQLESLIRKGKSPAQRLLKARILLKADVSEAGDGWSDSKIGRLLKKHSQAPSPRTMGHPTQGQQRVRGRDGGRAGRLHAAT